MLCEKLKALSAALKVLRQPLMFWIHECVYRLLILKNGTDCNDKLGKVWFNGTFLVKFHESSVKNSKSLKQLSLSQFEIAASNVWPWIDNFKYQILTLQNQKIADE